MKLPLVWAFISVVAISCSSDDAENRCGLEPDAGPCEAAIPKYYFDNESGECKEFLWGGCEGVVPFDTMEACLDCVGID